MTNEDERFEIAEVLANVCWAPYASLPGDALTPSEGITTFNTCTLISQISAEMAGKENNHGS